MSKQFFIFFLMSMVSHVTYSQEKITPSAGNNLEWHTSLQEAHVLSTASHKPIFAFFTGSDWCGWCHKLQNDVFSKPEFISWAKKNVILLELDFPRKKRLTPELEQQNNGMQQALKISGYPTVWLLFTTQDPATNNFNLSTLGSLGYPRNAVVGNEQEQFLNEANKILLQQNQN
ncbi:MAG: thioredoxin family protein [Bacteroidia bacterium]|nr:thioredoxin family protein [Bacteroidia bacterium]